MTPVADHGERAWVATFHDGTLTVFGNRVDVITSEFHGDPVSAIRSLLGDGPARNLDEVSSCRPTSRCSGRRFASGNTWNPASCGHLRCGQSDFPSMFEGRAGAELAPPKKCCTGRMTSVPHWPLLTVPRGLRAAADRPRRWTEMKREPSALITYLVLIVGFVLTLFALVGAHVTLVGGDYTTTHLQSIACAALVLAIFVLSWSRLHPIMRVFSVFLGLVAAWSLFMAAANLLGVRLPW